MKLEIDTTGKTIKIIGTAELTEFLTLVANTFAEGELSEYTIIGQEVLPLVTYPGTYPGSFPTMPDYSPYPSPYGIKIDYPDTCIPRITWCDTSTISS